MNLALLWTDSASAHSRTFTWDLHIASPDTVTTWPRYLPMVVSDCQVNGVPICPYPKKKRWNKSSQGPRSLVWGNPRLLALNVNPVDSFLCGHDSCSGTELGQVIPTHWTLCQSGWLSWFGELISSPHSWFYLRLSGFQPSLLYFHFCYCLNTGSLRTKVCYRTCPLCDAWLLRSARCSCFLLQKSHRNHGPHEWMEALSDMVFMLGTRTIWYGAIIGLISLA